MLIRLANIIGVVALSSAGCTTPHPVNSAGAACTAATARVTAERGLPIRHVAWCDPVSEGAGPPGYHLLSLHAHCREAMCGSTNMGWFVVQKTTGEVFEWEVAESTRGRRVPAAA